MTDLEEREWRGLNRFDAIACMDEADKCSPAVLRPVHLVGFRSWQEGGSADP